jgi:hypothetical protein
MSKIKMMAFGLLAIFLSACGKDEHNGGSESGDAITAASSSSLAGTYYARFTKNDRALYSTLTLEGSGRITLSFIYFDDPSLESGVYRKSEGTFTKSGNDLLVTWADRTCGIPSSEIITITGSYPINLLSVVTVKINGSTLQLMNSEKLPAPRDFDSEDGLTEDSGCNQIPL